MFAVTRAARHRDRSLVALAGCQLIPWDGDAGSGEALGSVCLVAPSYLCQGRGCSPGGNFVLLYSLGSALLWTEALREKARGERVGFVLNVWCSGIR